MTPLRFVASLGLLALVGMPAPSAAGPTTADRDTAGFALQARALLEGIRDLDARSESTRRQHDRAVAERDVAQRRLDRARATQHDLATSASRSRAVVGGGAIALWRLHGREALSGILGDRDPARSARTWRNLGLLVRYATAAMQVHAARLTDQSRLVSTLEERAAEVRDLERKVSSVERDLELEEQAKRRLLSDLLNERERALEAASLAARSIDGLTAGSPPGSGGRGTDRPAIERASRRPKVNFGAWRGRLKAPVSGAVVSRFGEDRDQRGQTTVRPKGVRFAAEPDAPVRATLDGRVVHRGYLPGLGNVVILEHGDDYFTVYGHLGEVRAVAGNEVSRGEAIATAGSSGVAEGPSVYFEIRHGSESLDPRRWLEPETVDARRAKGSRGRT